MQKVHQMVEGHNPDGGNQHWPGTRDSDRQRCSAFLSSLPPPGVAVSKIEVSVQSACLAIAAVQPSRNL